MDIKTFQENMNSAVAHYRDNENKSKDEGREYLIQALALLGIDCVGSDIQFDVDKFAFVTLPSVEVFSGGRVTGTIVLMHSGQDSYGRIKWNVNHIDYSSVITYEIRFRGQRLVVGAKNKDTILVEMYRLLHGKV